MNTLSSQVGIMLEKIIEIVYKEKSSASNSEKVSSFFLSLYGYVKNNQTSSCRWRAR